jgi:cell division protein FtsB
METEIKELRATNVEQRKTIAEERTTNVEQRKSNVELKATIKELRKENRLMKKQAVAKRQGKFVSWVYEQKPWIGNF